MKRLFFVLGIAATAISGMLGQELPAIPSTPQRIVFDTDIGGDLDDAYALKIATRLHKRGYVNLLAVTTSTYLDKAAAFAQNVLVYEGLGGIPVGANQGPGSVAASFCAGQGDNYAGPTNVALGLSNLSRTTFPTAVSVLRTALGNSPNGSVTIVVVGGHTNIAGLMQSTDTGDGFGPGSALFAAKVAQVVSMHTGNNPSSPYTGSPYNDLSGDYNLSCDATASAYAYTHNGSVPMVFNPMMPNNILIGGCFNGTGSGCISPGMASTDPVKVATDNFITAGGSFTTGSTGGRPAWDPSTVFYPIVGTADPGSGAYFVASSTGTFTVTSATNFTWDSSVNSHHSYVLDNSRYLNLRTAMENLLMADTPSVTTANTAVQIYTAIEAAACGDVITIGAGTYTLASGNLPKIHLASKVCASGNPITIKAFDPAHIPVFDYRTTPLDGVLDPGNCASGYANAIPGSYGGSDTNRGAWQIANSAYVVLDGVDIRGATDNDCITDSVAGIRLTSVDHTTIRNSHIQQNWDGIFGAGSDVTIEYNTFVGNGYFGNDQDHQLYNGGGDNWIIRYNTFLGSGTGAGDGCCIHTDGSVTAGGGQNIHTRAWHAYVYGNWIQDGQDYEFDMATPTNCSIAPTGTCTSNPVDTTAHLYFYNNVVVSNAAPINLGKMSAIIGNDGLNWCPGGASGFCGGHQQMHLLWNTFYVRSTSWNYTSGTPQPPNDTCCQFSLMQLTNQAGYSTQDLLFYNNVVHFVDRVDSSKKALFVIQSTNTWSVSGNNNWFDSDIVSTCPTLVSAAGGTCLLTSSVTGSVPPFANLAGLNFVPTSSGAFGAADTAQTWQSPLMPTAPALFSTRATFTDRGALTVLAGPTTVVSGRVTEGGKTIVH